MSELLPIRVRSLGGSISVAINATFASIVTLSFDAYNKAVTPQGTWWSFALILLLSILFVLMFLPETNGRTLEQIQTHFETGKIIVGCLTIRKRISTIPTENLGVRVNKKKLQHNQQMRR